MLNCKKKNKHTPAGITRVQRRSARSEQNPRKTHCLNEESEKEKKNPATGAKLGGTEGKMTACGADKIKRG